MTDTPLLRLARLMLRFVGNESSNDPDSLNLHAALFDLVRDLEAAPPPETERPPSPVETALREFAGFISGDIPELHRVEVPRIAESVSRYLNAAGPHVPPAPARRTITREEFNAARVLFLDEDMTSSEVMTAVAAAWRLTVEEE